MRLRKRRTLLENFISSIRTTHTSTPGVDPFMSDMIPVHRAPIMFTNVRHPPQTSTPFPAVSAYRAPVDPPFHTEFMVPVVYGRYSYSFPYQPSTEGRGDEGRTPSRLF